MGRSRNMRVWWGVSSAARLRRRRRRLWWERVLRAFLKMRIRRGAFFYQEEAREFSAEVTRVRCEARAKFL